MKTALSMPKWLRYGFLAMLLVLLVSPKFAIAAEEEDLTDADEADEEEEELAEEEEDDEEYEDDDEYQHPLSDMPTSSADIVTGVHVVSHTGEIQLGDEVEVICGFRNTGDESFNITHIMGSLNNPDNFRDYMDNFTMKQVNRESGPHSEMSVDYRFNIPEMGIQSGPMQVSLTVFYQTGADPASAQNYSTTFLNSTVLLVEAPSAIDQKTMLGIIVLAAVGGLVFYLKNKNDAERKKDPSRKFAGQVDTGAKESILKNHVRSGKKASRP